LPRFVPAPCLLDYLAHGRAMKGVQKVAIRY
jgi:hypothetical protein